MLDQEHNLPQNQLIGEGRSGQVFSSYDEEGRHLANKVFVGETLAKLVTYILSGAPQGYIWNRDAISCAHHRRRILALLVEYWFPEKLRVAQSYGVAWNEEFLGFELHTRFVEGRYAKLTNPFSGEGKKEFKELVHSIMEPIQGKLLESGFDGLVWQAGYGNPVAANNFLLEYKEDGQRVWHWIDLESGVPALFPINPLKLLTFYLPKSFEHKRALFDDVNTSKLENYFQEHRSALEEQFGSAAIKEFEVDLERLAHHQKEWKSLSRVQGAIRYNEAKQKITTEQADWYIRHPLLWYLRESSRMLVQGTKKVITEAIPKIISAILRIKYLDSLKTTVKLIISSDFRIKKTKEYTFNRIQEWGQRQQLSPEEKGKLEDQLDHIGEKSYLMDFGVHITLWPLVKLLQYFIFPSLYAMGLVNGYFVLFCLVFAGSISRTLYTLGKIIFGKGPEKPWLALIVGMIPKAGNGAYLLQMLYSASKNKEIAKFLWYDLFSKVGASFPIWGGEDTQTEHFFNWLAHWLVRRQETE